MGLEATIVILDNSKFALNGDILPSRFDAQCDALDVLARAKLDENQESAVGLMTMGGHSIQVEMSLSRPFSLLSKRRASSWPRSIRLK